MFFFKRAAVAKAAQVSVKRQRDPRALMGLERMLLHWLSVMAFVVTTSLRLGKLTESTAVSVLQFVFLPFALAGVLYSVWRYYMRQRSLQQLHSDTDAVVDKVGLYGLVLLVVAVLGSLLGLRLYQLWSEADGSVSSSQHSSL